MKTIQTDNKIIEKLKLKTLSRFICDTDKGTLKLQLRKGENTYHLVLDSIPLEKELNEELMSLLFPAPITVAPINNMVVLPVTKKIGRPKGSKTGDSTMK